VSEVDESVDTGIASITRESLRRAELLQSPTYEFPPRVNATDFRVGLIVFIISVIAIELGSLA
jgi:hypothetical protein